MNPTKRPLYFLIACLSVSLILVYFIIKPFLGPLILAAVFAFLFQSLYVKFMNSFRGNQSVAALATTFSVVLLVMLPVALIGFQIFKESSQLLYSSVAEGGQYGLIEIVENAIGRAFAFLPLPSSFQMDSSQYLRKGLEAFVGNLGSIFSSFARITLDFFVFLTALYFLLKDGPKLKKYLVIMSPLDDQDDEFIVNRLKSAVSSVVRGSLTIGLVQGLLTGIGFAIFGVPNAVLWGSVAAIASLIPGIGTAMVILPAVVYLFITGNTFAGLGMLVWGVLAVGLIDNFLGPKLVGLGMQVHPLAIFLSVIGGLAFFGPMGILLGPLTVSICIALIETYPSLVYQQKKNL